MNSGLMPKKKGRAEARPYGGFVSKLLTVDAPTRVILRSPAPQDDEGSQQLLEAKHC